MDYTISIQPKAGHVHVSALIQDHPGTTVTVAMPLWVPGYYRILNPQTGVSQVTFTANGKALTTEHPTDATWSTTHEPNQPLRVDYDVKRYEYGYGLENTELTLGQMGIHVDRDSAFLHPGVACMYVQGHTDAPCTLKLDIPEGWDTATPLPIQANGAYAAANYDVLNDSPVQVGKFRRVPFKARGHGFEIIITGKTRVSDSVLTTVCKGAAEGAIDLFQGWTPFKDYQFHFHFPPKREYNDSGLEHRSSCVIAFGGHTNDDEFVRRSAPMVSHEFLHAWIVKALKPEGLGPFDYQAEAKTPSLWLAEGITDYYAHVAGARAGLWTPESALIRFAYLANEYKGSPGRNKTSLVDSSTRVWQDAGSASNGSGGTNYYTKGLLVGWLLDIQIRCATRNQHSLDDAMRWLMRKYAVPNKGYPPDALLTAIKEATGIDVAANYKQYVHGTDELPFETVLPLAGILVRTAQSPVLMLGASTERGAKEPVVKAVEKGSAAEAAHILVGDLLLRIDGAPVQIGKRALLAGSQREVGDEVPVVVLRDGEERTITVVVKGQTSTVMKVDPNATAEQKTVWKGLWASDRFASR